MSLTDKLKNLMLAPIGRNIAKTKAKLLADKRDAERFRYLEKNQISVAYRTIPGEGFVRCEVSGKSNVFRKTLCDAVDVLLSYERTNLEP